METVKVVGFSGRENAEIQFSQRRGKSTVSVLEKYGREQGQQKRGYWTYVY